MKTEESSGVLPQDKHGGHTGHVSIELAVLRSLIFDHIRQIRSNYVLVYHDAKVSMIMWHQNKFTFRSSLQNTTTRNNMLSRGNKNELLSSKLIWRFPWILHWYNA